MKGAHILILAVICFVQDEHFDRDVTNDDNML
jgi:hypothetical protein